jgi:multisubunit Na+/H+ antiporter MnhC subunit
MSDISNQKGGMAAVRRPDPAAKKGTRTALLILTALVAGAGAYLFLFFSMLMIGFSFDAPGSHFTDDGFWLRLLMLWPPTSLALVGIAAIFCIFRPSLRPLWIALGLFGATILAMLIAISALG